MTDDAVRFAMAHASGAGAGELAGRCVDQLGRAGIRGGLGFIYASDVLAKDFPEILHQLRERTGIEDWVGTVGLGVCATGHEYFDEPALAVMIADLPAGSWQTFPTIARADALGEPDIRRTLGAIESGLAVVHADPRNAETAGIIAPLAADHARFLVGGLSSSRSVHTQVAGTVTDGGVSGVLLSAALPIAVGLTQGCAPIGPTHRIDAVEEHILAELDGEPALTVLLREAGGSGPIGQRLRNVHAALPVAGSDTGDYLVRNLIGVDPERGLVAIGEPVRAGDALMFVRRDAASAAKDLERMLDGLKRRAGGPPKAGLYFTCIARGPNLFEQDAQEMTMIRDRLGDFPLVGFFCNGEISHDRLYGYTGVLALFL